jgi:hypothetical protein
MPRVQQLGRQQETLQGYRAFLTTSTQYSPWACLMPAVMPLTHATRYNHLTASASYRQLIGALWSGEEILGTASQGGRR